MADMNSGVVTKRTIFRQPTAPQVSGSSVIWIDTSKQQPQARIYNPNTDSWPSVGIIDYTNLINQPSIDYTEISSGGLTNYLDDYYSFGGSNPDVIVTTSSSASRVIYSDGIEISYDSEGSYSLNYDMTFTVTDPNGNTVVQKTYNQGYGSYNKTINFDSTEIGEISYSMESTEKFGNFMNITVDVDAYELDLPKHTHNLTQ